MGGMSNRGHIVVIGAGFAGLVSARELRRQGFETTVLEARDRTGGRAWTSSGLGFQIEMGGTWVHWSQPHTWAETSRYGLRVRARSAPERMGVLNGDGIDWYDPQRFADLVTPGQERFLDDVRELFPRPLEPFARREAVAALDPLTVSDRLADLGLPEAERSLNETLWSVHFNAPASEGALTQALRWAALGGWDSQRLLEAAAMYKLADGMTALVDAIAADAGEVRLSTRVEGIVQTGEGVTALLEGGQTVRGDAAILAVPINTIADVSFEPALPAPLQKLAEEGQASRGLKLFIRLDAQIEPMMGVAPLSEPINHFRTEFWDEEGTVIVAYNLDGSLDIDDTDSLQNALQHWLPEARVSGSAGHHWTRDPLSKGTWGMLRPNQLTRSLEPAQEAHGRLFFAGSDLALGWGGFIDGAIESGISASRAVASLLAADRGL
jgi:monoamine oxidase